METQPTELPELTTDEGVMEDIIDLTESVGPLTGKPVEAAYAPEMIIKAPAAKKSPSAFRTISEVADDLNVQQHVLRFWETKFSQIRPLKRGGGRRYYRPEDVDLLKTIHRLLYSEGYTIKGVQKLFREKGKGQVVETEHPKAAENENFTEKQRKALQSIAGELRELRNLLGE